MTPTPISKMCRSFQRYNIPCCWKLLPPASAGFTCNFFFFSAFLSRAFPTTFLSHCFSTRLSLSDNFCLLRLRVANYMTLYIQMFHSKLQDPPKQIRGEALNPLAHVLPFPHCHCQQARVMQERMRTTWSAQTSEAPWRMGCMGSRGGPKT